MSEPDICVYIVYPFVLLLGLWIALAASAPLVAIVTGGTRWAWLGDGLLKVAFFGTI